MAVLRCHGAALIPQGVYHAGFPLVSAREEGASPEPVSHHGNLRPLNRSPAPPRTARNMDCARSQWERSFPENENATLALIPIGWFHLLWNVRVQGASSGLRYSALPGAEIPARSQVSKRSIRRLFRGLPDPMLLVRGRNLKQAQFAVEGKNVRLIRTETSDNGHWAFLWLESTQAAAQTLVVTAGNGHGQARHSFELAERTGGPAAHSGFSFSRCSLSHHARPLRRRESGHDPPGNDRRCPARLAWRRSAPALSSISIISTISALPRSGQRR